MATNGETGRRRALLRLGLMGAGMLPGSRALISRVSAQSQPAGDDQTSLPHLDEDSPRAQELAYTHDAESASARSNQSAYCYNCRFYTGDPSRQWGGCTLFPDHAVNADGWCESWAAEE